MTRENVLSPVFYAAGAVTGLASGCLEVFVSIVFFWLHAAVTNAFHLPAAKHPQKVIDFPSGSVLCNGSEQQSHQAPTQEQQLQRQQRQQHQQPQEQPPAVLAAAVVAAPQPAPAADLNTTFPDPPGTPKAMNAVPQDAEGALVAAPTPADADVADPGPQTPPAEASTAVLAPSRSASGETTPITADDTRPIGEGIANPSAPAEAAPAVNPRGSQPSLAAIAGPIAAEGADSYGAATAAVAAAVAAQGEPEVPPVPSRGAPTHGSPAVQPMPELKILASAPEDDGSRVVKVLADNGVVQAVDFAVLTPPLVSEPVSEMEAPLQAAPLPQPLATPAGRTAVMADLHHGGDVGTGGYCAGGIRAPPGSVAVAAERLPGATCSQGAEGAATPGSSYTQRLEQKRQSSRRKGAHKAKAR